MENKRCDTAVADREDRQKYRKQEYWEARFQEEWSNEEEGHEWFASYETFRHLITPICPPNDTRRILVPGNGNSSLSFDLVADYPESTITGGDFSPSVIRQMTDKYKDYEAHLKWTVSDIRNIGEEEAYDLVLEKGVLDALVAGSRSPLAKELDTECLNDVEQAVMSIRKAMKKDGRFLSISFASPWLRLPLLEGVFKVMVYSFISPWTGFEYYLYECRNRLEQVDFHMFLNYEVVYPDPCPDEENDITNIDSSIFEF